MRDLASTAVRLVGEGWVQQAWFSVSEPQGRRTSITAYNLDALTGRQVSGVCLVGAVVHAAGGPAAVNTQLVQRTLDLTWHTLHEHPSEPVRWCPPPAVRAAHVRDLTRWNDQPGRTSDEVVALLQGTARNAQLQGASLRTPSMV